QPDGRQPMQAKRGTRAIGRDELVDVRPWLQTVPRDGFFTVRRLYNPRRVGFNDAVSDRRITWPTGWTTLFDVLASPSPVTNDDAGFGCSNVFGGPCNTPAFERLAAGGLRYTRFHTTALCAPTRAALLTGRNHHSVGMGSITETATSAPGQSSLRPNTKAPLAEVLKLNGYSTAQFGKCHEVPVWQTSPMGPFGMWPTGSGFEYF